MPVSNVKLCFHIFHLFFFSIHLSMKSITGICQIEIIYRVISNTFAFTHHQLEKIASTFDVDVGQLLLFETTNLNNAVLVGSKRTIYFSTETSKQPIKYLLKYHCFLTIINFLHAILYRFYFSFFHFDTNIIGMDVARKVVGFNKKCTH